MMTEIKNKGNNLCKWSVQWQRKMEKALNDKIYQHSYLPSPGTEVKYRELSTP
jgi:hypothetical protein